MLSGVLALLGPVSIIMHSNDIFPLSMAHLAFYFLMSREGLGVIDPSKHGTSNDPSTVPVKQ